MTWQANITEDQQRPVGHKLTTFTLKEHAEIND